MIEEKITEIFLPYPSDNDRLVRVYVPQHEEGETFPVIYMTDGQNVFDMAEDLYGCWKTNTAVREEKVNNSNAAIIVGIHSDDPKHPNPLKRTNELTPKSIGELVAPDEIKKMLNPSGEVFDDFVVNVVMPAVEERVPVKKGRNNSALCGSSSGGLMTFFTCLSHPDKFCAAGVFSPTFMAYPTDDLRRWINEKIQQNMPYLYIYTGAGDDLENAIYQSVESTYVILMECYPMNLLNEVVLLENKHHESAWESVFKDFLHTFLVRREEF